MSNEYDQLQPREPLHDFIQAMPNTIREDPNIVVADEAFVEELHQRLLYDIEAVEARCGVTLTMERMVWKGNKFKTMPGYVSKEYATAAYNSWRDALWRTYVCHREV